MRSPVRRFQKNSASFVPADKRRGLNYVFRFGFEIKWKYLRRTLFCFEGLHTRKTLGLLTREEKERI